MPTPNPTIQKMLDDSKAHLAELKAERARLYPPNKDPLGSPDRYPRDYTPEQVEYHNQLVKQIEALEDRIDQLQLQLYSK